LTNGGPTPFLARSIRLIHCVATVLTMLFSIPVVQRLVRQALDGLSARRAGD